MAATRIFSLSRTVFTNKQALTSFLTRSYSAPSTSLAVSQFNPLRLRSLAAVSHIFNGVTPASFGGFRAFSTRYTQSSLNDSSPNWSNRPPKETILLDGCDFEHWLVVVEKPDESLTRDQIIDSYIQTLATVVGSPEEARMKIYSVSTKHYFAFGALVSEELSYKLKELPNVRWVLPDSYLDVRNKDYGGEPFINGQAVPYDPKYHDEWVRNNAKAMERNRRNDRPRNFDRSRNFERRRQNVQNQGPPPPMSNQGPPPPMSNQPPQGGQMPPNNMGAPNNMGGMRPGGAPNQGWQGPPPQGNAPNFQGGGYPQNSQQGPPLPPQGPNQGPPPPPNYQNYGAPNNNFRGPPPPPQGPNQGFPQNPNQGYPQNPNQGYPQNPQQGANQGYPQNPQGPPPNFQNYGPPGGNQNQYQGRDMPPMPPSPPRNY